jgi:hypothetical protein
MKDALQHPAAFALSVSCGLAFALSWILFYIRLRGRSYRGTLISVFIALSCLAGAFSATALVYIVDHSSLLPAPRDSFEWTHLGLGGFGAFSAIFMQIFQRVLPAQGPRNIRGGFRKGWLYLARGFTTISIVLTGFTLFLLVQIFRGPHESGLYAGLALSVFITYQYFRITRIYRERAHASRPLSSVLENDPRRPVLYLRAFKNESQFFDYLEPGPDAANPYLPTGGYLSFDQYLARTVERLVGPFIALGNPDDVFPPAGAARAYLDSSAWRQEFSDLAVRCAAILVVPGSARELRWELQHLLGTANAGKLHIVFGRYVYRRPQEDNRLDKWFNTLPESFDWAKFHNTLTAIGYTIADSPPQPGTVFSFDSMGRVAQITNSCATPEDYVHAIQARISTSRL